jgi:hypothetical protein
MRHIEKLRTARDRVGPELSNGQRGNTLKSLSDEIAQLEVHFQSEHECCTEMQTTIAQMQSLLKQLRARTSDPSIGASAHSPKDAES